MLNMNKIGVLLQKLIEKTKKKEMVWFTVPEYFEKNKNESLRRYIINNHKYFYDWQDADSRKYLDESKCACVEVLGGLIMVFVYAVFKDRKKKVAYSLALQSKIGGAVEEIPSADYQITLERLYKYSGVVGIKTEDYIDWIINDL